MLATIIAPFAKWIALALGIIATLFAVRRSGAKAAKQQTALEAAEQYAKTRKAIDHADTGIGASDAERIKRLSDFASKR